VICHEINDFTKLVNVAYLAERSLNDAVAAFVRKKRSMPQASYQFKRLVMGGSSSSAAKSFPVPQAHQRPPCIKCGTFHFGDCKIGIRTCFRCGQARHFQRNCPVAAARVHKLQGGDYQ
jgi:hypothetical protein